MWSHVRMSTNLCEKQERASQTLGNCGLATFILDRRNKSNSLWVFVELPLQSVALHFVTFYYPDRRIDQKYYRYLGWYWYRYCRDGITAVFPSSIVLNNYYFLIKKWYLTLTLGTISWTCHVYFIYNTISTFKQHKLTQALGLARLHSAQRFNAH